MTNPETLAQIGELELIERLKPFCDRTKVGDDAALLNIAPNHHLVTTTDVLVDTVHFSDRTTPPHAIGWRATAANLSDLAAMGAAPLGITIGLALPPQTPWPWVEHLYEGIADCLAQYGGAIIGGDLCKSNQRTLAISAFGQVPLSRAIFRHTAKPEMTVIITGPHGLSRAGLAVLLSQNNPTNSQKRWIEAHQYPVPKFDALAHLQSIHPRPTIAGMDSSDGLANALLQIAKSSNVGIEIQQSQLSIPAELIEFAGAKQALEWTLYGGEDFELVLCLPATVAERFLLTYPNAIAIGTTTDTGTVQIETSNGNLKTLEHNEFQHF